MQAVREGRPIGRRFGAAFIAACTIGAGIGTAPASALQLCSLLGTCTTTTATKTTSTAVAPDPGGQESPDQPVPAPAGKAFGFNSGLTLSGLASPSAELDDVQRVGGRYLRLSIGWRWWQPNATDPPVPAPNAGSTVARLDELYRQAVARGVRLIVIPGAAPLWATRYAACKALATSCLQAQKGYESGAWQNNFSPDPPHHAAFRTFVRAVKARWPQVLIEAWNEPNLYYNSDKPEWTSPPPSEFAGMQCAAYAGSKDVNAEPVLSAGWADNQYDAYVGTVYGAGGKDCWDLANIHLYTGAQTSFGAGTLLAQALARVRDMRSRYGDTDPLWVTETGFTTTDVSQVVQADALRRLYNRLVTMPDVGGVMVHTLRETGDGSSGPEAGYGLLHADGTVKPAYCQLARMAGSIVGGCPA